MIFYGLDKVKGSARLIFMTMSTMIISERIKVIIKSLWGLDIVTLFRTIANHFIVG